MHQPVISWQIRSRFLARRGGSPGRLDSRHPLAVGHPGGVRLPDL